MRVAIICPKLEAKGGAEKVALLLAAKLAARDHRVTVFTRIYNEEVWGSPATLPFEIRHIPLRFVPKQVRNLWLGLSLGRRLRRFDLVNPHNYPAYVWCAYARHLHPGFPPIAWFCHEPPRALHYQLTETVNPHLFRDTVRRRKFLHGIYLLIRPWRKRWEGRIERWAARQCRAVLTNSRHTAALIEKVYGIRADVCRLGIPLPPPAVTPRKESGERYAAVVTRLTFHKNVDTVLRAVARLAAVGDHPDFRLKIVGTGAEEAPLRELAASLGIEHIVEFTGFLPEESLQRVYAEAAFIVYVPLNEPFGLVSIEAMAGATPVIGTRDAGPGEVIEDGRTGLVVDPLDAEGLAAAMARLWRDPELCRRLGEAGRRFVEEHYTDEAFVERFLAIVDERCRLRETGRRSADSLPRRD